MEKRMYRVDPGNFDKGVKYARMFGGTFDGATKTWLIPTHRNGVENNSLRTPRSYGLIPVEASDLPVAKTTAQPRTYVDLYRQMEPAQRAEQRRIVGDKLARLEAERAAYQRPEYAAHIATRTEKELVASISDCKERLAALNTIEEK